MRVISGTARGTKLDTIETLDTRPTLDRVKEALFNIIQSRVYDSNVLDLFSGSGALGIETLSRGAKNAVLCDKSKKSCDIIQKNLKKVGLERKATVINKDYNECLNILKEKFDIIFLDPPYDTDLAIKSTEKVINEKVLSQNGVIIIETDDENKIINKITTAEIQICDIRKYGKARLVFLERKE